MLNDIKTTTNSALKNTKISEFFGDDKSAENSYIQTNQFNKAILLNLALFRWDRWVIDSVKCEFLVANSTLYQIFGIGTKTQYIFGRGLRL